MSDRLTMTLVLAMWLAAAVVTLAAFNLKDNYTEPEGHSTECVPGCWCWLERTRQGVNK